MAIVVLCEYVPKYSNWLLNWVYASFSEKRAPKGPPDLILTSACLSSVQLQPPVRTELPEDLLI